MKPIIIDMKDMSDSTEVYESRPNLMLAGFVYLILAMLIAAIVWMYFCKVDIVVKGTGTIAAADEVATVTNQVAGTITEMMVVDGQTVAKDTVLYTVSTEEVQLRLSVLESQLGDNVERVEMLKAYVAWLEDGSELPIELVGNLYYSEIASRKNLVELGKENSLQVYNGELSAYEAKLDANTGMITYYEEAVTKSKQMIEDIKNKENSFATTDTYYWNTVENFLVQYQHTILQYEDTLNQFREELSDAQEEIKKLEESKAEIQNQQEEPQLLTVSNGNNSTVSQGDAIPSTILQREQELESLIATQKQRMETAEKNISDYSIQKSSALNAYEKESIATIESNILGYQQNITSYEGANLEYQSGQQILEKQGTELEVNNLVVQEKYSVAEELESCRQAKLQMEQQMESLKQSIDTAVVKATADGVVNFTTELVEGDYIAAGTQVLTIIPSTDTGEFVVKSYVENKDIAKIYEGMEVTYEIAAYPSREYGTLKGIVTFVSADLKVNSNGSAYYLVETTVEASELRNQQGKEAELKVGMLCETKIVVEEKRVLEVLIEKLLHLTE